MIKCDKIIDEYIINQQKDLELFNKILKFKENLKWTIRSQATLKKVEGSETR